MISKFLHSMCTECNSVHSESWYVRFVTLDNPVCGVSESERGLFVLWLFYLEKVLKKNRDELWSMYVNNNLWSPIFILMWTKIIKIFEAPQYLADYWNTEKVIDWLLILCCLVQQSGLESWTDCMSPPGCSLFTPVLFRKKIILKTSTDQPLGSSFSPPAGNQGRIFCPPVAPPTSPSPPPFHPLKPLQDWNCLLHNPSVSAPSIIHASSIRHPSIIHLFIRPAASSCLHHPYIISSLSSQSSLLRPSIISAPPPP